jgi:hypothetical protein
MLMGAPQRRAYTVGYSDAQRPPGQVLPQQYPCPPLQISPSKEKDRPR